MADDALAPEGARLAGAREHIREGRGRLREEREIRDEAAEDLTYRQAVLSHHEGHDDTKEGEHDHADHPLQDPFEDLHALSARVVLPDHRGRDPEDQGARDHLARLASQRFGEEVLLQRGGAERELRQTPNDIGHRHSYQPAPAEDGVHVFVDRLEGTLAGGERHIGDGAQHDDAEDHRDRLQPEHRVAGQHAEVERARERPAAEGDRALQPAGAGELGVDGEGRERTLGARVFDPREFVCFGVQIAHLLCSQSFASRSFFSSSTVQECWRSLEAARTPATVSRDTGSAVWPHSRRI